MKTQPQTLLQTLKVTANNTWHDSADKRLIALLRERVNLLTFKFRAVFGSAHNHYILLDDNLIITDFNHKADMLIKHLFGRHMQVGELLLDYLHPESAAIVAANCKRALAGETFEVERKLECEGKPATWWIFQYSPAYHWDNTITGITFNARDITQQKAYEQKLKMQDEKLREISLMQSHDVRGPVCSIMGVMTIIKESGYKADRQCLKFIETAANLLDKNTRNIVDHAQLSSD